MLMEADTWESVKLASLAITWGIISEVDLRSDFLRFIGSIRFTLMFFYLLIRKFATKIATIYSPAISHTPLRRLSLNLAV